MAFYAKPAACGTGVPAQSSQLYGYRQGDKKQVSLTLPNEVIAVVVVVKVGEVNSYAISTFTTTTTFATPSTLSTARIFTDQIPCLTGKNPLYN